MGSITCEGVLHSPCRAWYIATWVSFMDTYLLCIIGLSAYVHNTVTFPILVAYIEI